MKTTSKWALAYLLVIKIANCCLVAYKKMSAF